MPPNTFKKRKVSKAPKHKIGRPISEANAPKSFKLTRAVAGAVTSSVGGVITNILHANDPSLCTDFTGISALFDLYKVTCFKLSFYPQYNVESLNSGGIGYAPIHVAYDPDDAANPFTSVDATVQYGNRKTFNMFQPWVYKCFPKASSDNSVNTDGLILVHDKSLGPMMDVAFAPSYQKGVVGWYGSGMETSTNFGTLILDYYVTFANRR